MEPSRSVGRSRPQPGGSVIRPWLRGRKASPAAQLDLFNYVSVSSKDLKSEERVVIEPRTSRHAGRQGRGLHRGRQANGSGRAGRNSSVANDAPSHASTPINRCT
jgi:hypothetical protein